jgi:hypothetical protein
VKLLKSFAFVALFGCGESVFAMAPQNLLTDDQVNAMRQERIAIHNAVYRMGDRAAAQQLRNLHLNDVVIRETNNQYSVHSAIANRNLCPTTTYLFVIESLNNLRDNHPIIFNLLINFVRTHDADDDIPEEFIIPALHENVASLLLQRIIRHIILNDNVLINEPDALR